MRQYFAIVIESLFYLKNITLKSINSSTKK